MQKQYYAAEETTRQDNTRKDKLCRDWGVVTSLATATAATATATAATATAATATHSSYSSHSHSHSHRPPYSRHCRPRLVIWVPPVCAELRHFLH